MIGNSHIPHCYSNFVHISHYHGNHSDMSVINLSSIVLRSHLAQRLAGTIGISLIPHCYENLVTMATKVKCL